MKYLSFISFAVTIIFVSCGPSEEELKAREAFVLDSLNTYRETFIKDSIAKYENSEILRIHNENIEVGKSKMKLYFTEYLEHIKEEIKKTEKREQEVRKFQLLRTEEEKRDQLMEVADKLNDLKRSKDKIQEEIALSEKHTTYDFQDSPEGVMKHIFWAAKNSDFSKFRDLIDPYGPGKRSKAYQICLMEAYPKEYQQEFIDTFKNGRIMGEANIDGNEATIEIAYGLGSNKLEKVKLIKRMDKWYFH